MYKVIDDVPEVVVLKSADGPGERIAFETANAIMRVLHDFVQQRPLEFFRLAQLCKRKYFRVAEKEFRKYFPATPEAAPIILAVFRAALVLDGTATRLGSPYDMEASYRGTGLLYDRQLFQLAHKIADSVYQTSLDFGNTLDCCWMRDCRKDLPHTNEERAQGLFLSVYCREFPNALITPWGTWYFVESTDYTRSHLLRKGNTTLLEVVMANLTLEPSSTQKRHAIFAVETAFGVELPPARLLPEQKQAGASQERHISAVWEHEAKWLDPARYF